ncbi:MAG: sugar phosphate isomerase/epimerase [Planctomycetota bacterium]
MPRPVTMFTGQWADLPRAHLLPLIADMGYDGVELACWGDHFNVTEALEDDTYCARLRDELAAHELECHAISNHLVGQAVCDPIDERHKAILPDHVWGDGDPDGVNERAAEELSRTAEAAAAFGVDVVPGFTGSPIWHMLYFFPPTSDEQVDAGYRAFAERFTPILDRFRAANVRFALEVHPTEIAYDIHTTRRALDALDHHPAFGFNYDPSHLIWQGIDPVKFIDVFADRIFHVHMKDAARTNDPEASILASHLGFGDHRRGWDFRSVGRGEVDFDAIIRALNRIRYDGPLSVEWEDSAMDREHGATESCEYVRSVDFPAAEGAFDAAFAE